ncbi:MAG: hypothetical protein ACREAW_01285 [Nitrososphaera sp.]
MMDDEFFHDFAAKVFRLSRAIRLIYICDDRGRILGSDYRKDMIALKLSESELEKYTRPWIMQILMSDRFRETAGDLKYIFAVYEKILSAAIQVDFNRKQKIFVILSIDLVRSAPETVRFIEDKILPLVGENKDYFM